MKDVSIITSRMVISMFELNSVIFARNHGYPCFGIPLFKNKSNSNHLHVAETDNYFKITAFYKTIEYENMKSYPVEHKKLFSVGQNAIIALIEKPDFIILNELSFFFTYESEYFNSESRKNRPLLDLQYGKIVGDTGADFEKSVSNAKIAYFDILSRGERWANVEMASRQSDEHFWRDREAEPASSLLEAIGVSTVQEAIFWLAAEKNFVSKEWPDVWRMVSRDSPFDIMLGIISINWLQNMYGYFDTQNEIVQNLFVCELFRFVLQSNLERDEIDDIRSMISDFVKLSEGVLGYLITDVRSVERLRTIFEYEYEFDLFDKLNLVAKIRGIPVREPS
jgi:hypothetical protein